MTVRDVLEKIGVEVLCEAGADRPVTGAVVGDLLSFVMGNAPEGAVWVTVVAHVNVAAVAVSVWLVSKASTEQILWGLGAMALGVPLYFFMKKQGNA